MAENNEKKDEEKKLSNHLSIKSFRKFVDLFFHKKEGMFHTFLYNNAKLVSFKEGEIVINIDTIKDPHFTRSIAKLVSKWTGRIWQISTSSSNIGKTLYEEDLLNHQKEIEITKTDPEVKKILEKYSEVKIHSITNIGEAMDETIADDNNEKLEGK